MGVHPFMRVITQAITPPHLQHGDTTGLLVCFMTLSTAPGSERRFPQCSLLAVQKAAEETPALRLLTLSHQTGIMEKNVSVLSKPHFYKKNI